MSRANSVAGAARRPAPRRAAGRSRSTSWRCSAMVAVDTTTGSSVATRARDRGNQIGQRLAGAGAGLHGEVLAGVEGVRDGLGHLDLAAALAAAERGDRGGQQFGDRSCARSVAPAYGASAGAVSGTIRVGIAGSPRDSFRPSHGRLCSPAATRVAGRGQVEVGDRLARRAPAGPSSARATSSAGAGGGSPAGWTTSSTMVPDGLGQPRRLLAAAVGFLVAAALLDRHAVDLDQLVDHARGGGARAGDQRRADAVACRRVRRAARRSRTRRGRRTPRCGSWSRRGRRVARGPGGPAPQVAGVDADRAQLGARRPRRRWPRRW